jgi:hypothetical protein
LCLGKLETRLPGAKNNQNPQAENLPAARKNVAGEQERNTVAFPQPVKPRPFWPIQRTAEVVPFQSGFKLTH